MRRQTIRAYTYLAYFTVLAALFFIYSTKDTRFRGRFSLTLKMQPVKLKYILQWTSPRNTPFVYMGIGQKGFIYRNCTYTNCYVTSDKNFLLDYAKFDVIAFAGTEVIFYKDEQLPQRRSPHQKYVFANIESAHYYPVCKNYWNGYFNWTWTYKLDSDLRWGYIMIKDVDGNIVGPKKEMQWIKQEDMKPVSEELNKVLRGKTKLAAWFVSNCVTINDREGFVFKLNNILNQRYNLTVDVYGDCGSIYCSRDNETECFEKIERDYFFYLSFENAFSEDYVTEKLLNAVQHYAVPIVFGGANYSRFMPDRSYLNARELGVEKLAEKMYQIMNNFDEYVEFFRWTNHYTYHRTSESLETDEYCNMCKILNDEERVNTESVHTDLRSWWDPPEALCYLKNNVVSVNM